MDTTMITSLIHAIMPNAPEWVTGLLVVITVYLIGMLTQYLGNKHIVQPGHDRSLIKGTTLATLEVIKQEPMKLFNSEKAENVETAVNLAISNPNLPSIDKRVDKAIKQAGGILSVISGVLSVAKLTSPIFRKH